MDALIVSTSNAYFKEFWQNRLTQTVARLLPSVKIICVSEDWNGGAGNGLGTLLAYEEACNKAQELYNFSLDQCLEEGGSIALYHTAGEGRRLYPLAASEMGNKSAIKLPGFLPNSSELLTILEAVILQTSSLMPYRKGRLSVFWGDQLFHNSTPLRSPQAPVELLIKKLPWPSQIEWEHNKYGSYGTVISYQETPLCLLEKMSSENFADFAGKQNFSHKVEFGLSLGCFSLSLAFLKTLLSSFITELRNRSGKLDTDIHFWMPLILDENTYLKYASLKEIAPSIAQPHYQRLQVFKNAFKQPVIGVWDIGSNGYWWDFGTTGSYYRNCMKLFDDTLEGTLLRKLLGWKYKPVNSNHNLLVNVEVEHLNISNSIVINSKLNSLQGDRLLLYQVYEEEPLVLQPGEVRTDVYIPGHIEPLKLYGTLDIHNWNQVHAKNSLAYSDIRKLIEQSS